MSVAGVAIGLDRLLTVAGGLRAGVGDRLAAPSPGSPVQPEGRTDVSDQLRSRFQPEPNRWTTFFRLLLAIPWFIVATFWLILFAFTHLFAWVAVVILGRYPQWLYEFNSGVVRFSIRTSAWIYLQTDVWPPFSLSDDPSYPIRVNFAPAAERQSRLKAFFRIILVLPVRWCSPTAPPTSSSWPPSSPG